jgi:hypothetical protein
VAQGTVPGGSAVTGGPGGERLPEAVAALPDVPGAVSTRPDVLAARSSVVASRERLAAEVDQLGRSARATFDLKARVGRIPEDAAEDPVRAAAIGAAGTGAVAAIVALIRRSRRPKKARILPEEVEDVIGKLGKNGDKVRRSLESSFASYLREHGVEEEPGGRGLRRIVGLVAAPLGGAVARELLKRVVGPSPEEGTEAPGTSRPGHDRGSAKP